MTCIYEVETKKRSKIAAQLELSYKATFFRLFSLVNHRYLAERLDFILLLVAMVVYREIRKS